MVEFEGKKYRRTLSVQLPGRNSNSIFTEGVGPIARIDIDDFCIFIHRNDNEPPFRIFYGCPMILELEEIKES